MKMRLQQMKEVYRSQKIPNFIYKTLKILLEREYTVKIFYICLKNNFY